MIDTKVHDAVEELSTVLDTQEKTRANGRALRRLGLSLARLASEPEDYTVAIREVLGEDRVESFRALVASATALNEVIEAATDRPTADVGHLADSLRGLAYWLDGETKEEVEGVLARWDALKPKTGATSKPDLGFTVTVRCDEHGMIASSQKLNVNSLRDAVRMHHGKEHGSKFGKGDAVFVAVTDAIKKVMVDGLGHANGGGYTVQKNGGLRAA